MLKGLKVKDKEVGDNASKDEEAEDQPFVRPNQSINNDSISGITIHSYINDKNTVAIPAYEPPEKSEKYKQTLIKATSISARF